MFDHQFLFCFVNTFIWKKVYSRQVLERVCRVTVNSVCLICCSLLLCPQLRRSWRGILVSGCPCVYPSVGLSIHSSRTVHARVMKFHIWIPQGKRFDAHFFFLSELSPFWSYAPLKNQNEIWCMPYLMNHACWGFEISYMDSSWKNSWPVFFFLSELSPLLELCPFEKISMKSCQQDMLKSIWARGLKLDQLIGDDE